MYKACSRVVFTNNGEQEALVVGNHFNSKYDIEFIGVDFKEGIIVVSCSDNLIKVYTSQQIEADLSLIHDSFANMHDLLAAIIVDD